LDPQSATKFTQNARVAGNLAIANGAGVLEEGLGVLVLGEVDDAVQASEALGMNLELGPALGSAQEGVAPDAGEVAAILQLSGCAPRFPRMNVASLLSARESPLVIDPLEPSGVGALSHDDGPLARPNDDVLAGRQGAFTRGEGARLGERDRAEANRRRQDSEQCEVGLFLHNRRRYRKARAPSLQKDATGHNRQEFRAIIAASWGSNTEPDCMRVLVTGGAGYVGSVVVEELVAAGAETVVVLDDLSSGHAAAVSKPARLVRGDIADGDLVGRTCRDDRIDVVVHMAASSLVGQSMSDPSRYYRNNMTKGLALLDALVAGGVRRFVFSSTAAVYGEPAASPITEEFALVPTNTYGETKLAFERALRWYEQAYGIRHACLRYFNACGATAANGEQHDPETHLIPIVLQVAAGKRPVVPVFGDTYPTPDGTCVRDYVHVSDLARAHVLAIEGLERNPGRAYNLGGGGGYSVRQVIDAAAEVTGKRVPSDIAPRRAGDPAVLVASSDRIRGDLSWKPEKQDLRVILADAWAWMRAHPDGYEVD
jgi:UDP-glucose 4-epimerase